jgi:hypothetical protein
MNMIRDRLGCRLVLALAAGAAMSATAAARPGPDITLQDIPDVAAYGNVGTTYGYAIGSATCNIGNANLTWANGGTPALGMNAYKLLNGRLTQVGLGFCKTACCAAAGTGCGTCNGQGGSVLGAGCRDVYGGGFNGGQSHLAPRSVINAWSGAFTSYSQITGDAIFRRLQIGADDLNPALNPGAQYFMEGIYVCTEDAQNLNSLNNATYKRATVSNFAITLVAGSQQTGIPAIRAWHDHGLGPNVPDPSVFIGQATVPSEGTYWYGYKVTNLGSGTWRYDYAVFNVNSDRSGGGFSIPIPAGVSVANIGFSAPHYHSSEVYSNTPWTVDSGSDHVAWNSPEPYSTNQNSNALRWGTMYNFWFEANTPPTAPGAVSATLSLFKPFTPGSITFGVQGPSAPCYPNCDSSVTEPILNVNDFVCFQTRFAIGDTWANCDGSTNPPVLTVNDFLCFTNAFAAGCP